MINIAEGQPCNGSWVLQRPIAVECNSGQWIGWQNEGNPAGCPINPIYTGVQTNTFTFTSPVSGFSIDFNGFDGASLCSRIQLKVNGIFFPLTTANLSALPTGSTCTGTSIMTVTADGYLVSDSTISAGGQGRIIINGVTATSVDISTNDEAGSLFTNPFNCIGVVPLKLESFTGNSFATCSAILNWKTGTELNTKNIEIQRSKDGSIFNNVGEVSPKGSDSRYSFVTGNSSNAYFRLKINDLDGDYEYSNILSIKSNCINVAYQAIPNPASSSIEIMGLKNDDKIFVLDIPGRIMLTFTSTPNNNKLDVQKLAPGMYILQIVNAGMIKSNIKLLKN